MWTPEYYIEDDATAPFGFLSPREAQLSLFDLCPPDYPTFVPDKASEAILALKPVTFRYRKELDPDGSLQFGLVAEEVEKVNPDLVARDANEKAYTVRYEAVNAMLLNEFLKEHRTVEELKKELAMLTATVKEQAAQIQKVSAQLEASKPARQVVNNP